MNGQPILSSPSQPEDPQLAANARLEKIEEHLRSIRSMLTFFTVLAGAWLILQFLALIVGGFAE